MLALAQAFKQLSYDISQGRARLTLSDQLRSVSEILRKDLSGLTVDVDPTSNAAKSGYFMYYEGPIADHHPTTVPNNNLLGVAGSTIEQNLSASKYGDLDDILMFTARANGEWFRGKVPLALVKGATMAGTYPVTDADWTTYVVVASEYAEIAYFMVPKITPTLNAAATPYGEYVANADLTLPIVDNGTAVNPGATGAIVATGNGVPDQFSLCRRVLLILPSLNIPSTTLSTDQLYSVVPAGTTLVNPVASTLRAAPLMGANVVASANSSRLCLANAYQRCDLSVRRGIYSADAPSHSSTDPSVAGTFVYNNAPLVANSLESLANPMNRFAHITLPGGVIPSTAGGGAVGGFDRSMPILSLSAAIPLQNYAIGANILLPARADGTFPECGFMRPEFLKRKFNPITGAAITTLDPAVGGLVEVLSNEELLATNCIGFDLKGFDPVARLLYNKGADAWTGGRNGRNGADGAGVGVASGSGGWASLGAAGSDDIVVSPSDPGYLSSINYVTTIQSGTLPGETPTQSLADDAVKAITASQGAFVDIGWAYKTPLVPTLVLNPRLTQPALPSLPVDARTFYRSSLSGTDANTNPPLPSRSLRKSGRVLFNPNPGAPPLVAQIYQPCFDSYTNVFEHDGFRQWDRVHTTVNPPINAVTQGSVFSNGLYFLAGYNADTSVTGFDLASNGLDDDTSGIADDESEQDSSPPIPFPISAIQALIRLEDAQTNVIQQIAVTHDLLSH